MGKQDIKIDQLRWIVNNAPYIDVFIDNELFEGDLTMNYVDVVVELCCYDIEISSNVYDKLPQEFKDLYCIIS